jgi:hypothetical protein
VSQSQFVLKIHIAVWQRNNIFRLDRDISSMQTATDYKNNISSTQEALHQNSNRLINERKEIMPSAGYSNLSLKFSVNV